MHLTLQPYDRAHAPTVLTWVRSDAEATAWASLPERPADPAILDGWHAEEWVLPFLGIVDGHPVAYGELWDDAEEDEVELARILVDPGLRGQGIGGAFTAALTEQAASLGRAATWLRMLPENASAIACYRAAGYERAGAVEEAAFNAGQPAEYVWMRPATG
jgi:ribosomal protein S18 acetylase RimI-like enzyme